MMQQQITQVETLAGQHVERIIDLPVLFDYEQPFLSQVQALLAELPLSVQELQTVPVLINPPALNFITAVLLAELHGRMGYFPPILRIRPVKDSLPLQFEVAEIINLQALRDNARQKRQSTS